MSLYQVPRHLPHPRASSSLLLHSPATTALLCSDRRQSRVTYPHPQTTPLRAQGLRRAREAGSLWGGPGHPAEGSPGQVCGSPPVLGLGWCSEASSCGQGQQGKPRAHLQDACRPFPSAFPPRWSSGIPGVIFSGTCGSGALTHQSSSLASIPGGRAVP